jgi:hypothetical protein
MEVDKYLFTSFIRKSGGRRVGWGQLGAHLMIEKERGREGLEGGGEVWGGAGKEKEGGGTGRGRINGSQWICLPYQ